MPEHNPGQMGGTMRLGKRRTLFQTKNSVMSKSCLALAQPLALRAQDACLRVVLWLRGAGWLFLVSFLLLKFILSSLIHTLLGCTVIAIEAVWVLERTLAVQSDS